MIPLTPAVVVNEAYRFVPPSRSLLLYRALWPFLGRYLRSWGVHQVDVEGLDGLRRSHDAGHGVLLAPNHCRNCDPFVLALATRPLRRGMHTMTSWHMFKTSRLNGWLMRHLGGFSMCREGVDHQATRTAIDLLAEGRRPLLVCPEGLVTRRNDRLADFQPGFAFVAHKAAQRRAALPAGGRVVVHPLAIRYAFEGDLHASLSPVLDRLEDLLAVACGRHLSVAARVVRVNDALLAGRERDRLGAVRSGPRGPRRAALIEHLLRPLEAEWVRSARRPSPLARCRHLQALIVPDMAAGRLGSGEFRRRYSQLVDLQLVKQLARDTDDDLAPGASPERLIEAVQRCEEDLTGQLPTVIQPLRATVRFGEAIPVPAGRRPDHAALVDRARAAVEDLLARGSRPAVSAPAAPPARTAAGHFVAVS